MKLPLFVGALLLLGLGSQAHDVALPSADVLMSGLAPVAHTLHASLSSMRAALSAHSAQSAQAVDAAHGRTLFADSVKTAAGAPAAAASQPQVCAWDSNTSGTSGMCTGKLATVKAMLVQSPREDLRALVGCVLEDDQGMCERNQLCAWRTPPTISGMNLMDLTPSDAAVESLKVEQLGADQSSEDAICMSKDLKVPDDVMACISQDTLIGKLLHCLSHTSKDSCGKDVMCSWGIDDSMFLMGAKDGMNLFEQMEDEERTAQQAMTGQGVDLPVDQMVGQLKEMCVLNIGDNPTAFLLSASTDPMLMMFTTCMAADALTCAHMTNDCEWSMQLQQCVPNPQTLTEVTLTSLTKDAAGGELCDRVVTPWLQCGSRLEAAQCSETRVNGMGCRWGTPATALGMEMRDELWEMEEMDGEPVQDVTSETNICHPVDAMLSLSIYMFPGDVPNQELMGGIIKCPKHTDKESCVAAGPLKKDPKLTEDQLTAVFQAEAKAEDQTLPHHHGHAALTLFLIMLFTALATFVGLAALAYFSGRGPLVPLVERVREKLGMRYFRAPGGESLVPDREVDFYSF